MIIAFLHTAQSNESRFSILLKKVDSTINAQHFVNEQLLTDALQNQQANAELFKEEINKIKDTNPSLIICTCSSYGELCQEFNDVYSIDEPIAAYLVKNYANILMVYAANSTKSISHWLLERMAKENNRTVHIKLCDCTEYWKDFEKGDHVAYKKNIADKIKQYSEEIDAVFLAQASMDGVQEFLPDYSVPIFTSPEMGVIALIKKLKT